MVFELLKKKLKYKCYNWNFNSLRKNMLNPTKKIYYIKMKQTNQFSSSNLLRKRENNFKLNWLI